MRLVSFDETLDREMQDEEFALAYLRDALDESSEEFDIALVRCVEARSRAATRTGRTYPRVRDS